MFRGIDFRYEYDKLLSASLNQTAAIALDTPIDLVRDTSLLTINDTNAVVEAKLQTLVSRWQALDAEYLDKISGVISNDFFEMVKNYEIIDEEILVTLSHPHIKDTSQTQDYYRKLFEIFKQMPNVAKHSEPIVSSSLKCMQIKGKVDEAGISCTFNQAAFDDEGIIILPPRPENTTASAAGRGYDRRTSYTDSQHNGNDCLIYTFTICDHQLQRQQCIDVLGNHTLAQLKDIIYCVNDLVTTDNPKNDESFFFINDIFYIDTRPSASSNPHNEVRTRVNNLRTWLLNNKQRGDVSSGGYDHRDTLYPIVSMENTRIDTLNLSCYSKYLYKHEGICEHILLVSDVRYNHPIVDVANQRASTNVVTYPCTRFRKIYKKRKCCICESYSATKIVFGDRLAATNPAHYCETCYYNLHYDVDENILYDDFRVFPYVHDF